ncbi:hypothetical protein QQ045_033201 [Rhodiola kirilowii]
MASARSLAVKWCCHGSSPGPESRSLGQSGFRSLSSAYQVWSLNSEAGWLQVLTCLALQGRLLGYGERGLDIESSC